MRHSRLDNSVLECRSSPWGESPLSNLSYKSTWCECLGSSYQGSENKRNRRKRSVCCKLSRLGWSRKWKAGKKLFCWCRRILYRYWDRDEDRWRQLVLWSWKLSCSIRHHFLNQASGVASKSFLYPPFSLTETSCKRPFIVFKWRATHIYWNLEHMCAL